MLTTLALLVAIACFGTAAYLFRSQPSPMSRVFMQAHTFLSDPNNFNQHGFTPKGIDGIPDPKLPHCVLGAVAMFDPYYKHSVYGTPANEFLRQFALDTTDKFPETINDQHGHKAVLTLLKQAARAA